MKKSTAVRIISYCAAFLTAVCGYTVRLKNDTDYLKMQISGDYSGAAEELCVAASDIDTALKKAIYTTSAETMADISAKLFSCTAQAKSALSRLQSAEEPGTLGRFLSQVGNYAEYLTKKLISGEQLTDEERENVRLLSETAAAVSETVDGALLNFNNPETWMKNVSALLDGKIPDTSLADAVYTLDETVPAYPTLIYDGPYSEPADVNGAKMLAGENEISREEALDRAAEFIGVPAGYLDFACVENGNIEGYVFTATDTAVTVSVRGGYPVYFRKYRQIGDAVLSYNQAIEKATRLLYAAYGVNFKYTYYYEDEGVTVINFACRDGAVTCYTDLIKIGIAMDNGETVFFDAEGYLLNHTERAVPTPAFSEEQAREKLSPLLNVISSDNVLIPTESGGEVYCYEFCCESQSGDDVNVYIGTSDLKEQKILILVKNYYGTLTK